VREHPSTTKFELVEKGKEQEEKDLTIPHPTIGIFFKASFNRMITPLECPA
jgi:hypothetical protein